MKAKDLMIGDIVRVAKDVCLKKGTVVIVHGIDADNRFTERGLIGSATCVAVDDEDRMSWGIWTEFLEPIPLTEEILEKNGFEKGKFNVCPQYYIEDNDVFIGVTLKDIPDKHKGIDITKGKLYFQYDISYIKEPIHVHQLQHALRLCGIDKEIIL